MVYNPTAVIDVFLEPITTKRLETLGLAPSRNLG
jgi:hypothetical protein